MTWLDSISTGQVQKSWECDQNEQCTQVQNFVRYTHVRQSVKIIPLASFIQGTAIGAFVVKTGFN